jgi:hypothetical protein
MKTQKCVGLFGLGLNYRNKVLFMFFLGILPSMAFAQEALPVDEYLNRLTSPSALIAKQILYENTAALFIESGVIQENSNAFPQKLVTDASSLLLLESEDARYKSVKVLEIKISQESDKNKIRLDTNKLRRFTNLAYVLITSEIEITTNEVTGMLTGFDPGDIILIYKEFFQL